MAISGQWGTAVLGGLSLCIFGYYLLVVGNYLVLHTVAILGLKQSHDQTTGPAIFSGFSGTSQPGVAILVPAYNEEETILESLPSLLNLDYPDKEIVVVNDGSTDATLTKLEDAYDLRPISHEPDHPLNASIDCVYRSQTTERLVVIDKANGGKSEALNAGLWFTDQPLFCAVDSDTIIEQWSVASLVQEFIDAPETVAAGGTIRVANGSEFDDGELRDVHLGRSHLVAVQTVEYLRAFYMGRFGLGRLRCLLLISGAFGVFRTDVVREVGGYRTETITEDFDLVVRLHRHLIETGREYRVAFVPDGAAWTEVPSSLAVLSRQRRRWFRGLVETLRTHWDMIGNPRYGRVGVYGLPYFLFVEMAGPLVEGAGYLLIPLSVALGVFDVWFLLAFFVATTGLGSVVSMMAIYGEHLTRGGYDDPADVGHLIRAVVLENVGYRQWLTMTAWFGFVEYVRGIQTWGEMERQGVEAE